MIEDQTRFIDDAVDGAHFRELGLLGSLDNVAENRPLAERDLHAYTGEHQLGEVVGNGVCVRVARQLRTRLGNDGRERHCRRLAMIRTIASATSCFRRSCDGFQGTVAADDGHLIVVGAHADAFLRHIVDDDEVEVFGVELRTGVVDHVLGLSREPDDEDTGCRTVRAECPEDVDGGHQLEGQRVRSLLELLRCHLARPPVRHGGGHDQHARAGQRGTNRRVHLVSGFHRHHLQPAECSRGRTGCHQRHRRALPDRRRRQLVAHLAARSIADESHRVDRLSRAACRDHDVQTVDGGVRPRRQGLPSPSTRSHPARPSGRCSRGRSPAARSPGR